ncbi:hypothetical protein [Ruminococcus sp.]
MMKTKKLLAFLLASAMMCTAFTACGDKEDSSKEESSAAETTAEESSEEETSAADESSVAGEQVQTGSFEEPVAAESGDAYLAMVDGEWYVQYWGTDEDLLTYDAGVVPITGDGEYTVSVNGATAGLMYDVTGDANGDYTPSGMSFMAVMVKDGTTLYPNMAIEITSIKMNGEEVPMTKKNYTSSDDGVEMRANIYNEWVNELSEDAHDANGAVTDASAYSAQIVDKDAFNSGWTSVEVTFNVTGTGK